MGTGGAQRGRARCSTASGSAARADVPAGQLTYIDQKRLELARALALDPSCSCSTSGSPGSTRRELADRHRADRARSRDEGLTIILVEHVMDAIRSLCDRCVVMNAGQKIADGSPADGARRPEVIAAYLGDADA